MKIPNNPPAALRDVETGKVVLVDKNETSLSFLAADVPSMGYRTYLAAEPAVPEMVTEVSADSKTNTVENQFFRIVMNPKQGCISSFVDKQNGRGVGYGE